jgi:glycosyltransferase involved in cell wall biosynthesis
MAAARGLPIVFTHHTRYERYTHYVPGDSPTMVRFVKKLVTDYANQCDHVIAPSESIAELLTERGIETPISAIPTGIHPHQFSHGHRMSARQRYNIPEQAVVLGHVGRLAPEKNLPFLARALVRHMQQDPASHALIVGDGPSRDPILEIFQQAGLTDRLHMPGKLEGQALTDAYHAMDIFAFASMTETQGVVLTESMAAGVPVVAIDAPGAREVVTDQRNGRLLSDADETAFAEALSEMANLSPGQYQARVQAAKRTAEQFSIDRCTDRLLELYQQLLHQRPKMAGAQNNAWSQTLRLLELEWHLWSTRTEAAVESIREGWRTEQ